jgi:hypothetical protein
MDDVQIIENTEEAMNNYGHCWGSSKLCLTNEMLQALSDGKCIACNIGEYTTFVMLEGDKFDK